MNTPNTESDEVLALLQQQEEDAALAYELESYRERRRSPSPTPEQRYLNQLQEENDAILAQQLQQDDNSDHQIINNIAPLERNLNPPEYFDELPIENPFGARNIQPQQGGIPTDEEVNAMIDRGDYHGLYALHDQVNQTKGLDQETIGQLNMWKERSGNKECVICGTAIEVGDQVICTPCGHQYHSDCLLPWLEDHQSCPVCYNNIKKMVERQN
eukprot:gb/GECH01009524.1/.p1 GENE.gb/GECH01009524.1/~~gb/GECH01009524.1/.p1  ORF type:complete len:214 (+),score=67.69 gb/GECH01009524.1/:1-642(+)